MNREALKQLIRVLEEVETLQKPLDMSVWMRTSTHTCGTAGCALGYAAKDSWFNDRNLHLEEAPCDAAFPVLGEELDSPVGFEAAELLFSISPEQTLYIFDASYYHQNPILPSHVIARVRELLEQNT